VASIMMRRFGTLFEVPRECFLATATRYEDQSGRCPL